MTSAMLVVIASLTSLKSEAMSSGGGARGLLERALLCECRARLLDLERPLEPDLDLELLLDGSDTARTPVSTCRFERLLERERLLEGVASAPPAFVGAGDTSRFLYSAFLSRLLRRTMYGS
ncbi:hypothetical protein MTO96_037165 [Rhipicephalus appendiculatus]